MRAALRYFRNKYFAPSLDLRIQAFNLLGFAGIAAGLVTMLSALLTHAGLANIILNLFGSLAGCLCLYFVRRTNRYRAGFVIVVVLVFLVVFPLLFFSAGGYRSGMPCFFIFAIVFTAIMLDGKTRTAFIILEFALYAACFFAAHFFPYLVMHPFATEFDYLLDALTGVVVAGLILAVVVLLYMRIYDNRQKQLESLDRLKTEFFQNMNHDMKTPLAVLASYIGNADDMLDHGVGIAEVQECLEHAGEQIGNLARMVDYSLSLAAAQEGKWRMETLDFAALLRSGAGAFRSPLQENGNTLSLQIPDGLPKITGNGDMLQQAINNLLSNAAKHTQNGEIAVSLNREGGKLTATVADTGEGISPALLPGVFKRGASGDGTTGYGLSICKTIVETHGGEIRIESEPGRGTTVCFTLPIGWEGTL